VESFLSGRNWKLFYSKGHTFAKAGTLVFGLLRRAWVVLAAWRFDFIFIHREAAPIGPPVFEWFLAKILRKKIIYDFDDAVWLTDRSTESLLRRLIKWRSKIRVICKWSYKVSVGNEYLADFARKTAFQVMLNPTTIDTSTLHNPELFTGFQEDSEVIVGWTGSHTTLKYLATLEGVLQTIEARFSQVHIQVIADRRPQLSLRTLHFYPWSKRTEVADLMRIDIGIMPLPDNEWSKGKCGFKALQYMALSKPVVASPVGVNTQIVEHGKSGFLCRTDDEWVDALSKLIEDRILRRRMGEVGRNTVVQSYSVDSNAANFASLFE
jgi:glycosyltransferase involved in cell wall biosynthesis